MRLGHDRPQPATTPVALDCRPHLTGHCERDPPRPRPVSCAGTNCTLTGPDQARRFERRSSAKAPATCARGRVRDVAASRNGTGNAVPIVVERSIRCCSDGSSRQPNPSAAPAGLDDRTTGACRHAVTKPVFSRPFAGVRLERPLHLSLVSSFRCRSDESMPRRGDGPVKQVPSTRQDQHLHLARENTGPPDGRDRSDAI